MKGLRLRGLGFGGALALAGAIFVAGPWGMGVAYSDSGASPAATTTSVPVPSATCTPSGGSINLGSTVACSFSGTADARFLFWSAPGFSPQSSNSTTASFTAARAGNGTITAFWSAPGVGAVSQSFTYLIVAPTTSSTVTCTPDSGSLTQGSTVSCSFSGSGFMFWSAPGFSPPSSSNPTATFSANRLGSASITAHWAVPGQGAMSQTFSYTIVAP